MASVEHWGALTIGTGLGNARFTNIAAPEAATGEKDKKASGEKGERREVKKKKKDKEKEKEKA